jgi:hypothetical protein
MTPLKRTAVVNRCLQEAQETRKPVEIPIDNLTSPQLRAIFNEIGEGFPVTIQAERSTDERWILIYREYIL